MKTSNRLEVFPQKGIFIGIPAAADSANRLENFKYDAKNKSWHNMLGYEKFFSNRNDFYPFNNANFRATDSVYVFQRHNGAQQWFLFETNGRLNYLNLSSGLFVELQDERLVPTPDQPHTSYEPFGRYVIITNGNDGPIKFRGQPRADAIQDLGWRQAPGTPVIRPVGDPDSSPQTFLDSTDSFFNDEVAEDEQAQTDYRGLGSDTANDVNRYSYKVSFLNEAGSESPLSQASVSTKWTSVSTTRGADSGVLLTGLIIEIPTGPQGTVARRIYRTTNNTESYFFCEQLNNNIDTVFTDFKADSQLGAAAPLASDSIIFPAPGCRFSATFKNCLFVDGGQMDPTRLYYSRPLQPDTYKNDDYFEVGTREGGDITGLMPYYNSLLVFRENAIDLIRGDALNGFELIPFIQGVGTLSPHTIVPIPNLGLSFLSQDGIYLMRGGLDGGSDLQLTKISVGLQEFFDRISRDLLPAAVGVYSQKERELHYYMSIDGKPTLNLGIVYHTDNGEFSTRDSFPVKCVTTDKDGNIIFGYNDNNVYSGAPAKSAGEEWKGGLGVISGIRQMGYVEDSGISDGPDVNSKFRSAWHDFEKKKKKKHVKYVYLYILTKGNVDIRLEYYKDRNWANGQESEFENLQRADQADQSVYGKDKWQTAVWEDKLLTPLRFDIADGACTDFAFEFEAAQQIEFIGYAIEYEADRARIIQGKR